MAHNRVQSPVKSFWHGFILISFKQTNIYRYEIIIVYSRCHPCYRVACGRICLLGNRINSCFAGDSNHRFYIGAHPAVNNGLN